MIFTTTRKVPYRSGVICSLPSSAAKTTVITAMLVICPSTRMVPTRAEAAP